MNIDQIKDSDRELLLSFWDFLLDPSTDSNVKGKGFELLICRAFHLEGANVSYSYSVSIQDVKSEELDGLINCDGLYCLIECKNQKENVDFEPFSKLRSRLQRRPSSAIGSVFTTASFTQPAIILNQFLYPQTILTPCSVKKLMHI